jgi:monovalent cation:proton antiporter-2 (CPA2) family protein
LRETLAFLVATVVLVPLSHRLKASPVLGYLIAGTIIGPFGLGLVNNVEGVTTLAEFGVVFLMFAIGLEVSPNRLWSMRTQIFGLGSAQVVLSAVVIGVIAWAWGNSAEVSVLLGACLALSSTAIVMQILIERGALSARFGRAAFSVLLLQDIAVVPVLFLINVFGAPGDEPLIRVLVVALARALFAIAAVIVVGRAILGPLFRITAKTSGSEVFLAMALLAILGTAILTGVSGLSMALGAFLAGLVIAETEFRHQIEIDIQPFKGLLLGLFFMSVGMGIDFSAVADRAFWLIASVVGLVVIKTAIAAALARAFGLGTGEALRAGMLLGPAGEFAFVVIGAAVALNVIDKPVGQFMLIVAGLSMVTTPFMDIIGRRVHDWFAAREIVRTAAAVDAEIGEIEGHVVIAGFGRVGRMVARFLDEQHVPYIAFDRDSDLVRACRRRGQAVFFGDSARTMILDRARLDHAAAVVISLNEPEQALKVVTRLRRAHRSLPIFVRTRDTRHSEQLVANGATHVIPETVESSLRLGALVLQTLGSPRDAVDVLMDRIREAEYDELKSVEVNPRPNPKRKAARESDTGKPG